MQIYKTDTDVDSFDVTSLLEMSGQQGNSALQIGMARFPKGKVFPEDGFSTHAETEVSLILSGALVISIDGEKHQIEKGDLLVIPAGESHVTEALEDSAIYFALYS